MDRLRFQTHEELSGPRDDGGQLLHAVRRGVVCKVFEELFDFRREVMEVGPFIGAVVHLDERFFDLDRRVARNEFRCLDSSAERA